jgi:hypothetical protein
MPKARVEGIPQINGQFIYGSISIETLPDGSSPLQIPVWDGVQWHLLRLIGGGGMDISINTDEGIVEVFYADNRVYYDFTADAIIYGTVSATATANSILLATVSAGFTADAELV